MEDLTFLVRNGLGVCARSLLVFLLACACSVFLNAGRSSETSSQRVIIVLVLHSYDKTEANRKLGRLQWKIEGPELRSG